MNINNGIELDFKEQTGYDPDDYFVCYNILKDFSKTASKYELQAEFMSEMFKILGASPQDVLTACAGALQEWDI
jgi:hypothetical protein